MKVALALAFLGGALSAPLLVPSSGAPGAARSVQDAAEMAAMMEKAKRYTQPGSHHELLKRFLGTWDTSTRITGMPGDPEAGTAEYTWLFEGRWLKGHARGRFLGAQHERFSLVGYDNFKQSYVLCDVSTVDTAMHVAEGDLDPRTDVLLAYGTLDEYLTGEIGKMVKTVWRFPSEDEMLLEIHDLAIGEEGTKVVEVRYRRRKGSR